MTYGYVYKPGMRWGGYLRISDDPNDTHNGVDRQKRNIRKAVRDRGGDPDLIRWYDENDTSAYQQKRVIKHDAQGRSYQGLRVVRPWWDDALHDLRSDVTDGLIVWDMDRMVRQPRDLEDAIELVQVYPGKIIEGPRPGQIDLSTPEGREIARQRAMAALKSSEDTSRRVKDKQLWNADEGKPVGGKRPFGWEEDQVSLRPSEADLLRKGALDLLAGVSINAVTLDFEASGLMTDRKRELREQGDESPAWTTTTVRGVLRSPRMAGWRIHQGKQHFHSETGEPVKTCEPILDQDTWKKVVAYFEAHKLPSAPRPGGLKHVLSGLARCLKCGSLLRYNALTAKNTGNLTCPSPAAGGCAGVSISASKTLAIVEAEYQLRVDFAVARPKSSPWPSAKEEELDTTRQRQKNILEQFRLKGDPSSAGEVMATVNDLGSRIRELELEQRAWAATHREPAEVNFWHYYRDATDLAYRRELLKNAIEGIFISPSKTGRGGRFDPDRITIGWKPGVQRLQDKIWVEPVKPSEPGPWTGKPWAEIAEETRKRTDV